MLSGSGVGPENTISSLVVSGVTFGAGTTKLYAISLDSLTSLDISGTSSLADLRASSCALTTINMDGTQPIGSVDFHANDLDQATVDYVLGVVDAWGTSNGTLDLSGNTGPSTTTGQPLIDSLTGRGWTVTTDTPTGLSGTLVWSDEFDRADGAPGSPWQTPIGGETAAIVSGKLQLTGGTGYQRCWALPSELTITDYAVELEFDGNPSTMTNWGILVRMDGTGAGAKCLFTTSGTAAPRIAGATNSSGSSTASGAGVPASWSTNGTHTVTFRIQARVATILCDGQEAWTQSASSLDGAGTGVGICGESQGRSWNAIRVYTL